MLIYDQCFTLNKRDNRRQIYKSTTGRITKIQNDKPRQITPVTYSYVYMADIYYSRGSKALSGVCVLFFCVCVCLSAVHDKTKTAETTITRLATAAWDSPLRVIAH